MPILAETSVRHTGRYRIVNSRRLVMVAFARTLEPLSPQRQPNIKMEPLLCRLSVQPASRRATVRRSPNQGTELASVCNSYRGTFAQCWTTATDVFTWRASDGMLERG